MPPPKRPFTTSSLTSTLKSTIASQPLLSNLTNIDKLSSQATSLAQRTAPFFGALNTNVNNISNPNSNSPNNSTTNNQQQQHSNNHVNQRDTTSNSGTMIRGTGGSAQQQAAKGAGMATTPTVDMSHLTEEERLMIQSVMAKAEMADMGMPVDTSAPSRTNLPSQTSQALTQQTLQSRQMQQQQQQQQQGFIPNPISNQSQGIGQVQNLNQQQQMNNPNRNQLQQTQMVSNNQNDPFLMQQQPSQNATNQSTGMMNQNQQTLKSQNNLNQQNPQFNQNMQQSSLVHQQQQVQQGNRDINLGLNINPNQLPTLEQQTQQLVNQINSQFNLGPGRNQDQLQKIPPRTSAHQQQLNFGTGQHQQQIDQNNYLQSMTNIKQQNPNQLQQQSNLMDQNQMISGNQQELRNSGLETQQQLQLQQQQINQAQLMQKNQLINTNEQSVAQQNRANIGFEPYNQGNMNPIQNQIGDIRQQSSIDINVPQSLNMMTNFVNVQQYDVGLEQKSINPYSTGRGQQNPQIQPSLNGQFNPIPANQRIVSAGPQISSYGPTINHMNQISQLPANRDPIYGNDDIRDEIRFGPQQNYDLNDYYDQSALSDQEYHRGHDRRTNNNGLIRRYDSTDSGDRSMQKNPNRPHSNESNNYENRDINIQAYDLAHKSPRHPKPSRQLPHQPDVPSSQNPIIHDQGRVRSKEAKSSSSAPGSRKQMLEPKHREQDSPRYLSGSEEEFIHEKSANSSKTSHDRKTPTGQAINSNTDKSESPMRILNEIKLTEQANQVMEQQQLLIKQSQELIKLQLEQQALSQELKKAIKQTNDNAADEKNRSSPRAKELKDVSETKHLRDQEDKVVSDDVVDSNSDVKTKIEDDKSNPVEREKGHVKSVRSIDLQNKKSTSFCNESDIDDSPRNLSGTKVFTEFDDDSSTYRHTDSYANKKKIHDKSKTAKRAPTTLANSGVQTSPPQRFNRDLLQSPTDTTDSDFEPINHVNSKRYQQRTVPKQNKSTTTIPRRREPTGLPPSPLPVAAAIQLHQMQQQHLRQQLAANNRVNQNRLNYLRSRSVTSSPCHLYDRSNSGYLTDNQRIRSTSPDTMSEFGGRRRKRLPEPPTNAVPMTPSMVRKMIQAQKNGVISGKLLTSVNAQSTQLTNMHASRLSSFEPKFSGSIPQRSIAFNDSYNENSSHGGILQSNMKFSDTRGTSSPKIMKPGPSGVTKFIDSTYGTSLLKSNITDVKETPELDKLISNLDEYYGLDTRKRQVRLPEYSGASHSTNPNDTLRLQSVLKHDGARFNSQVRSPNLSVLQGYSPRTYTNSMPTLMRCNSEGESSLLSKFSNRNYSSRVMDDSAVNRNSLLPSTLSSTEEYQSRYGIRSATDRLKDLHTSSLDYCNLGQSTSLGSRNDISLSRNRPGYTPIPRYPETFVHGSTMSPLESSNQSRYCPTRSTYATGRVNYASPPFEGDRNLSHDLLNVNRYRSYDATRSDRHPYLGSTSCMENQGNSDLIDYRRQQSIGQNRTSDHSGRMGSCYQAFSSSNVNPSTNTRANYPYINTLSDPSGYLNPGRSITYSNAADNMNHSDYGPDRYPISNRISSNFATLTKDDIINSVPKFDSVGYRFRTENQNKYVVQSRTPVQCAQSKYPYPYKRILLSKNPKDRIGNGIGVRIIGGQTTPSLYDKVNKCIVTSGAFVTEVFQNSNVHFMGDMQEGDQIIEWNGVNLCNRSNDEVQQILLSQFSDDEVEIVYIRKDELHEAYGGLSSEDLNDRVSQPPMKDVMDRDQFDQYADMSRSGMVNSNISPSKGRYWSDGSKGSIRRKISLSSLSHIWSSSTRNLNGSDKRSDREKYNCNIRANNRTFV